MLRNIRN